MSTLLLAETSTTAAFDMTQSNKALVNLINPTSANGLSVKGKRVLVPGCGRGYDCIAFALAGAEHALGLEISSTATKAANDYIAGEVAKADELDGKAKVVNGDFFKHCLAGDQLGGS
eukprot:gene5608-4088_t